MEVRKGIPDIGNNKNEDIDVLKCRVNTRIIKKLHDQLERMVAENQ